MIPPSGAAAPARSGRDEQHQTEHGQDDLPRVDPEGPRVAHAHGQKGGDDDPYEHLAHHEPPERVQARLSYDPAAKC